MTTYFAQVDNNNTVTQVIVADQAFVDSLGGKWIQTDYDGKFNKNYAGIGYGWDGIGFFPPKCHDEAVLNTDTYLWNCTNPAHDIKPLGETNV